MVRSKYVMVPDVAGLTTITKPLAGNEPAGTDGAISGILSAWARLPQVAVANVTRWGIGRQFIRTSAIALLAVEKPGYVPAVHGFPVPCFPRRREICITS